MSNKKPKPPWADEPTPLCDKEEVHYSDIGLTSALEFVDAYVARDLEQRLRHAARLLGTIRVDCMLDTGHPIDNEWLEQQLSEIERTLTP